MYVGKKNKKKRIVSPKWTTLTGEGTLSLRYNNIINFAAYYSDFIL